MSDISTLFFDIPPQLSEEIEREWLILPKGLTSFNQVITEQHKPWEYMYRGRLYHGMYSHRIRRSLPPEANSVIRRLKTEPYSREVAGGGYKHRF